MKQHPPRPSENPRGTVGARTRWLIWPESVFATADQAAQEYEKLVERPPDRVNHSDGCWWLGWISKREGWELRRRKEAISDAPGQKELFA